ncbi:bifunctional diaminohydroxyphosphoribosylaminopyrimidine deaminase/5-amino-6-(5-phosphoribosylamino)uracil reductase RibD [Serratia sp. M24T3]|uniref:bifunctional diaminohydroxyphosphoribosylaminopyrimidine deaminase/5-amino-6-(5-phosphoribosylamino)uracil reductase RibD n=1 Tax=Serratia sp. M24T3 TaxID=932213 RepID=UPI00025BC3C8|nr:bifunctional diaminohydroxyphosphoribosylaminopyrimidine deaminase/5-amino-6-(5-phosphoribosylamino)uracil reductase RibD [Serratia sp. M24T3]EIC82782.1 bifunctional diaminohydroxyphosphoribosylaminopyrimidine deaminase/5-amino-6-(5-phosphoribosylamino)uracil reductase [Serratia sp. M24T3]
MFSDDYYMARAFELARKGRFTTTPNPNVGCVIVRDGEIVGEGYHIKAGGPHAEVHALRMAGEQARGATAYVTLEPCSHHGRTPPCADALLNAGIIRVVAAMQDPNPEVAGRGLYRLRQAGVEVSNGLMLSQAEAVNLGFLKRMRTGFPYVQLKMAASLDGRTAMASGESQWITSAAARQDVQRFRAASSAILSSSATVLADDPSLTVRWSELDQDTQDQYNQALSAIGSTAPDDLRQPLRVIVDSKNRVTPQHKLVHQPGETLLARLQADGQSWPENLRQLVVPATADNRVDLVILMMQLAKQQVNSVWVEAGSELAGALLQAGLVDELIIYMAPKLLGDNGRALCVLPGLESLTDAPAFEFSDVRQVGPDLRLRMKPVY